jgi:DNA processing protein
MADRSLDNEKAHRLALLMVYGIGPVRLTRLLNHYQTAQLAWQAPLPEIEELLGNQAIIDRLAELKKSYQPLLSYRALTGRGVSLICLGLNPTYPPLLKSINNPPPVLFVRGDIIPQDHQSLAVVGTRNPTSYGLAVTRQLVAPLARGLTIISGLARGIDAAAHQAALDNNGRTIAVLAGDVETVYPPEHTNLAQRIIKNGALVSKFQPGQPHLKGNFAIRNRLISGLSLGTLVIEGAEKSGTKITADFTLKQQRCLMAVPGPVQSLNSAAPHSLLKKGAHLVTSAEDIHRLLMAGPKPLAIRPKTTKPPPGLSPTGHKIWQTLIAGKSLSAGELIRSLNLPAPEVLGEISLLELMGFLENRQGCYSLKL